MDMSKENVVNAFISSGKSFQDWLRIRQFRITGSSVYAFTRTILTRIQTGKKIS